MRYWIGVTKRRDIVFESIKSTWWCVPSKALAGDQLLLYCPSKVDNELKGVFAVYVVSENPSVTHPMNGTCQSFGTGVDKLFYVSIKHRFQFLKRVQFETMSRDITLSSLQAVRRKFQGTIFPISKGSFERIVELGSEAVLRNEEVPKRRSRKR